MLETSATDTFTGLQRRMESDGKTPAKKDCTFVPTNEPGYCKCGGGRMIMHPASHNPELTNSNYVDLHSHIILITRPINIPLDDVVSFQNLFF